MSGAVGIGNSNISIHVLRKEDDVTVCTSWDEPSAFLSTSSARRTTSAAFPPHIKGDISIHVLREEDDLRRMAERVCGLRISIHVLREEDDVSIADPLGNG